MAAASGEGSESASMAPMAASDRSMAALSGLRAQGAVVVPVVEALVVGQRDGQVGGVVGEARSRIAPHACGMGGAAQRALFLGRLVERVAQHEVEGEVVGKRQAADLAVPVAQRAAQPAVQRLVARLLLIGYGAQAGDDEAEHEAP